MVLIHVGVNLWLFSSDKASKTPSGIIHDVLNVKCVFDVLNVVT
jgi:hypothetical protein